MTPVSSYRRVRMLWPDHLGLARGKYLPTRRAEAGSGFCVTTFGLTYDRDIVPAPGAHMLDGLRDVHGTVDPDSLHPSWDDDRTAVAVADLEIDGAPYPVSARTALKNAVAGVGRPRPPREGRHRARGLPARTRRPTAAGTATPTRARWSTAPAGSVTRPGSSRTCWRPPTAAASRVESASVEFDESQFEFTLEYGDALAVADDAFLFRLLVRERALALGLDFTFLGKPFPHGRRLRPARELLDGGRRRPQRLLRPERRARPRRRRPAERRRALRAPPGARRAVRPDGQRLPPAAARHARRLLGELGRRPPQREQPDAGRGGDRDARREPGRRRLDERPPRGRRGAARGWLGATAKAEPPPAYTGDGFEDGGTDVTAPTSLGEALDALEADTALVEAVGAELVANLVGVKRAELEKFEASGSSLDGDTLSEFETAFYLPYH